ncbi:putative methyltransferase NSUN7 [Argonauta hians]
MVMVILCSLMKTKFEEVPLKEKDTTPLIEDIQKAICSCKTKLNAWLARHRILANASSIEYLLPEQVRNKDKMSSQMNVYVWVNQQKTSIDKVIIIFLEEGFILTTDNVDRGKVFAKDPHCYDLLVFSSDFKLYLRNHHLLKNGNIVIQDKSSCIAPQSVASLIRDDDEVLHVNIGSGLSTAHISSLLYTTKFRIWGLVGPHQLKLAQKNMQILDIKNVKLLTDCFLDLSPEDERFKSVRIIVLTAKCSKSALNNPIDYVINEGEVPNVKSVLYLTRSVHRIENEETVMNVVDYANTLYKLKKMFKVVIPVLPFYKDDIEYKNGLQDKFIKFEPSIRMNGCFLAIIGLMKESDSFRKVFPKLNRNRKSTNGKRSQSKSNLLVYNQIYSRIKTEEPISMEQRVLNISKPNKINSLSPTIPAISSPLLSYTKKYSLTCSSSTDAFVRPIHSQSPPLSSHYFPKHSDILTRKTLPSVRLAWSGKSCEFIKTCMAEHKKIVNHPKPFR